MPDAARKTPRAGSSAGSPAQAGPGGAGGAAARGRAGRSDAPPADGGAIGLGQVWTAIRGAGILVLGCTLLGAGAGGLLATQVTDRFVAQATLIADPAMSGILDAGGAGTVPLVDPSGTATIVETIGTAIVVERALASLSPEVLAVLYRDAGLAPPGGDVAEDGEEDGAMAPEERTRRLVETLSDHLGVDNSGRSAVIRVSYTSSDPAVAAGVANAVTDAYLAYRLELRRDIHAGWLDRVTDGTAALRREMQAAERTAQDARERARLLTLRSETLLGAQQNDAIARSADLHAAQRDAERRAEAVAQVYAGLLRTQRDIETRIGWPERDVRLFAPAVAPVRPGGPGIGPLLLGLGLVAGFLAGTSLALSRRRRRTGPPA